MSVTLKNKALYLHEQAKIKAMEQYPYGHPARYGVWEEYNVPVAGADECHLSEFCIMAIWEALQEIGWPVNTSMFPCSGMKRLALISFLERLRDRSVSGSEEQMTKMGLKSFTQSGAFVGFNTQKIEDALDELIAFLYRNEEIYE